MDRFGKQFIIMGAVLILVGVLLIVSKYLPFKLGRLPGDISIEKENFKFYFPLTSSLIVSGLVSLVFWLFSLFRDR